MMHLLDPHFKIENFFGGLRDAARSVLFLDYDGTLAPFCTERDQAFFYPGVRLLLLKLLGSSKTRLVFVSGRPIQNLLSLLAFEHPVEIWGCHGWEHQFLDGRLEYHPMDEKALAGLAEVDEWVQESGLLNYIEQKPGAIAVHLRGLDSPTADAIRDQVERGLIPIACERGLFIQPFDGGIEIRLHGMNKGLVVENVLATVLNDTPVAYLGDDTTDEDAFCALNERGLGVLVRPKFRQTAAKVWLKPPEELTHFLSRWNEATKFN